MSVTAYVELYTYMLDKLLPHTESNQHGGGIRWGNGFQQLDCLPLDSVPPWFSHNEARKRGGGRDQEKSTIWDLNLGRIRHNVAIC